MTPERMLDLLLQANRFKAMPRAGWMIRGIVHPESVAAHSYGVAFLCLILAQAVDEPLDRAKLLTIALLHDLPESHLTDIPYPALRFIAPAAKRAAELEALDEITSNLSFVPTSTANCGSTLKTVARQRAAWCATPTAWSEPSTSRNPTISPPPWPWPMGCGSPTFCWLGRRLLFPDRDAHLTLPDKRLTMVRQ